MFISKFKITKSNKIKVPKHFHRLVGTIIRNHHQSLISYDTVPHETVHQTLDWLKPKKLAPFISRVEQRKSDRAYIRHINKKIYPRDINTSHTLSYNTDLPFQRWTPVPVLLSLVLIDFIIIWAYNNFGKTNNRIFL